MSDDWEDWADDDLIIPTLNAAQLKQLEERKLVEESDNALTKDLFSDDKQSVLKIVTKQQTKTTTTKKCNREKLVTNKEINERKQKEISKKNKEDKLFKKKLAETFGDAEEDNEYAEYEDQFY